MENKYRIEEIKEELKEYEDRVDWDTDSYNLDLDDSYDAQTLVDTYTASRILKEVDPICYNVGLGEYHA